MFSGCVLCVLDVTVVCCVWWWCDMCGVGGGGLWLVV